MFGSTLGSIFWLHPYFFTRTFDTHIDRVWIDVAEAH